MNEWKSRAYSFAHNIYSKGFFHLLTSNILLRVLGFGSQLFLIYLLTPAELGQIKTLQTYNQIALIFALFGFTTTTLKLCSENRPLDERAAILRQNITYSFLSTILVMFVLFLLSQYNLLSPDNVINELQPWFLLIIPATVALSMLMSYLQAIKQVKKLAGAQIIQRLVGIVLVILLTWLYGMKGFIAGTVLAAYVFLPLLIRYIREYVLVEKVSILNLPRRSTTLRLAGWAFLSVATHRLTDTMDILLLNFMVTDREAFGFYSIATIFLIPLREITGSIRSIALPYLSEKQEDKAEFMRVIHKYRKLMLLQAVGIVLLSWIILPIVINFFYGDKYVTVSYYFLILAVGYIFHSYIALLPTALISLGKLDYTFYAALTYLPIALLLHYILIKYYGLTGAAIAQVASSFVIMVVIMYVSRIAINKHFMQNDDGQVL